MLDQLLNFVLTHRVNPLTLQTFVKNLDVPCCVAILVKGMAINSGQRFAWYVGISHKSLSNC
jgi:hypothetical protein